MEWNHHSFLELNDPNFKSLVYQWQRDLYIRCIIIIIMNLALKPKERGHFIAKGSHSGKKKKIKQTMLKTESAEPRRHMLDILSYCSFSPFLLCSALRFPQPLKSDSNTLGMMTRCYSAQQESYHSNRNTETWKNPHVLHLWLLRSNENTPCWAQY